MKININWLQDYIDFPIDHQIVAEQLTMAGLEVDDVTAVNVGIDHNVVVGYVQACAAHPEADKLTICQIIVESSEEPLQIVCGAPNIKSDIKVAVAKIGSTLPDGIEINKAKLRGVDSFGMVCSAQELGIEGDNQDGIMVLPNDAPIGVNFVDYFQLDDYVIEVDLTPNRGDCLSILGIARELSAINNKLGLPFKPNKTVVTIDNIVPVEIDNKSACPYYSSRVIENINMTAVTPLYIKERLRRCGMRPINVVVDVSNYVMLELGQPTHAFDKKYIDKKIIVRDAQQNEKLILLDGKEIKLDSNLLIIADNRKPLALAGIMGGLDSSVTDNTTDIVIESAHFAPNAILGKARAFGLHTDSSHRFERGVDPFLPKIAMERVTELILEIAGGHAGPINEIIDEDNIETNLEVHFRPARCNAILGSDFSDKTIGAALTNLGISIQQKKESIWYLLVPSYRFDISIEEDVIEEIARIIGYSQIPSSSPKNSGEIPTSDETFVSNIEYQYLMSNLGFNEIISYSFINQDFIMKMDSNANILKLSNPLSEEHAVMRPSLLPGLLSSLQYNYFRQQTSIKLFEVGKCFYQNEENQIIEVEKIAGICCGFRNTEKWCNTQKSFDFYDIKGCVESLIELTGEKNQYEFKPVKDKQFEWLHPGQNAIIEKNGTAIGWVGTLHPKVANILDLSLNIFAFEIDIAGLSQRKMPKFESFSKYPYVRRDISIIIDRDYNSRELLNVINDVPNIPLVESIIFDLYQEDKLGYNKKSIGIGLVLGEISKTLTEEEVDNAVDDIKNQLKNKLKVMFRE